MERDELEVRQKAPHMLMPGHLSRLLFSYGSAEVELWLLVPGTWTSRAPQWLPTTLPSQTQATS